MKLNFGITFDDLYSVEGNNKVNSQFILYIKDKFNSEYCKPSNSQEIITLAEILQMFLVDLFILNDKVQDIKNYEIKLSIIHEYKKKFLQRVNDEALPEEEFELVKQKLAAKLKCDEIDDLDYAKNVLAWLENEEIYGEELKLAKDYTKHIIKQENFHKGSIFKIHKKIVPHALIDIIKQPFLDSEANATSVNIIKSKFIHQRNGFDLVNNFSINDAADNANYCLFCHKREKDSCRKGINSKIFKQEFSGCPLNQKISEINYLKSKALNIAALAVIVMDNPMCAATGHKICNDCMKSCIFQTQEPVNVPGIETNILDSVLDLDYGFEIYSLLTKWNPLLGGCLLQKSTYKKILVAGLGPAGFTSAHYLLNEGHVVVGIDGNKIEFLLSEISGISENGERFRFIPIKNIKDLFEKPEERIIYGFGGVSEYGITARWNKNYLKIIHIMLLRRNNFRLYGGIKFGSSIKYENFFSLGFDHLVLAVGAGSPKIPEIKNFFARGVRFAADFLTSLHLGAAFKKKSLTNLQLRMPIVVIGAGLTAIDVATEALEYYKVQLNILQSRFNEIEEYYGSGYLQSILDEEDKNILSELLLQANGLKNASDKLKYLKSLGGVKIIYYKSFEQSNSYKQNHQDVEDALRQGIEFIENITPYEFICDDFGALNFVVGFDDKKIQHHIHAKSAIIAIGSERNVDNKLYEQINKNKITEVGDVNLKYSGSVVKAMASSKNQYKEITSKLNKESKSEFNSESNIANDVNSFFYELHHQLNAKILSVNEIAKNIIEIVIHAPLAAENFLPGQFYKLQNYETINSFTIDSLVDENYLMEPIALTGASVNKERGEISLIILEYGSSSKLCRYLKSGIYISLMGPIGEPTDIVPNENVLLLGGGLGNAVLFSIANEMRKIGCKINYIAGYKTEDSMFKVAEIENSVDRVIWACEEKLLDKQNCNVFYGNIIDALKHYAEEIDIENIDRIITIGSDNMMNAVKTLFSHDLKHKLKHNCKLLASVNAPMQCMQGLCGQCLQKNFCIQEKKEKYIYTCKFQDQMLMNVDFYSLKSRLKQNSLFEILSNLYLKKIIKS